MFWFVNLGQLFKTLLSYNFMNPMDRINFSNELKNGNIFITLLRIDIICLSVYVVDDPRKKKDIKIEVDIIYNFNGILINHGNCRMMVIIELVSSILFLLS
tara:strand:+ start:113 stop:415 length:303 start_codon:yes stop_codon:yes gene_type:complete